LSELITRSKEKSSRGPYAAIGRIRIRESDGEVYLGTLILLKPRMSGLEMTDLLDYHRTNPDFPQQTTGDQFFDEAQWESYFRLGATIAGLAFAPEQADFGDAMDHFWSPNALLPIDVGNFPWFADEWLGSGRHEPDPTPAAAAVDQTPTGVRATARKIGIGPLVATALAGVGTLGIATGAGQSLATNLTSKPPVAADNRKVELNLNEEDRNLLISGVGVHIDAGTAKSLATIVGRLEGHAIAARLRNCALC
jgi:hypothetical protein